ncbi:MAG: S8 family peptidase [Myxococcaceae bacterium]
MRVLLPVLVLISAIGCSNLFDDGRRSGFVPQPPPAVPNPQPSEAKGTLTGALIVSEVASASAASAATASDAGPDLRKIRERVRSDKKFGSRERPSNAVPTPDFIPGEFIVRFEDGELTPDAALRQVNVPGLVCEHGGYASPWLHLLRCTDEKGRQLDPGQSHEAAQELQRLPGVRYVELNALVQAFRVPNDEYYELQWHYPRMNLPAAWDVTIGASSVVVAVIDTGILRDPDLDQNVLSGVDLISEADRARDGDGRDDDPTDMGRDRPNGASSWHGTHVAGTVAAVTNNGDGVAGVAWNARVLPVRVLGVGGGTDFDVAAGIYWSAGGNVPGVRRNTRPAKVLNLSLGGEGGPSQTYQEVIDAATATGAIIVVAAGNENADAAGFSPCNQDKVICVGATGFDGRITQYSNYGAPVDVMAPGGDMTVDSNGDGYPDGVLSTSADQSGAPSLEFAHGTSMASPHVAGLVALMASVNPNLNQTQAESILKNTANPASKCNIGCGEGMVDAHAAVLAAQGQPSTTGPAKLSVSTRSLVLRSGQSMPLSVSNIGGQALTVSLTAGGAAGPAVQSESGWNLQLAPGKTGAFMLTVDESKLVVGDTPGSLTLTSNGGNASVTLTARVGGSTNDDRPAAIAAVYQDAAGEWQMGGAAFSDPANGHAWSMELPPQTYFLLATIDSDGDEEFFEDTEPLGVYKNFDNPVPVTLASGQRVDGLVLAVLPQSSPDDESPGTPSGSPIGGSCSADSQCAGGVCETNWLGGYCTQDCMETGCAQGSTCVVFNETSAWCLDLCGAPNQGRSDCRAGYVCSALQSGDGICIAACTSDTDCGADAHCASDGYCYLG